MLVTVRIAVIKFEASKAVLMNCEEKGCLAEEISLERESRHAEPILKERIHAYPRGSYNDILGGRLEGNQ